MATGRDVKAVARAPYVLTYWTFLHLCQQERFDSLRDRWRALSLATLITLSFHKPEALADVHRQLREEAGLNAPIDQVIADHQALLAEIKQLDAIERKPTAYPALTVAESGQAGEG